MIMFVIIPQLTIFILLDSILDKISLNLTLGLLKQAKSSENVLEIKLNVCKKFKNSKFKTNSEFFIGLVLSRDSFFCPRNIFVIFLQVAKNMIFYTKKLHPLTCSAPISFSFISRFKSFVRKVKCTPALGPML